MRQRVKDKPDGELQLSVEFEPRPRYGRINTVADGILFFHWHAPLAAVVVGSPELRTTRAQINYSKTIKSSQLLPKPQYAATRAARTQSKHQDEAASAVRDWSLPFQAALTSARRCVRGCRGANPTWSSRFPVPGYHPNTPATSRANGVLSAGSARADKSNPHRETALNAPLLAHHLPIDSRGKESTFDSKSPQNE